MKNKMLVFTLLIGLVMETQAVDTYKIDIVWEPHNILGYSIVLKIPDTVNITAAYPGDYLKSCPTPFMASTIRGGYVYVDVACLGEQVDGEGILATIYFRAPP
jgi:hypothetical protein